MLARNDLPTKRALRVKEVQTKGSLIKNNLQHANGTKSSVHKEGGQSRKAQETGRSRTELHSALRRKSGR